MKPILARVLGPESELWAEMVVPAKLPQINFLYYSPEWLKGDFVEDLNAVIPHRTYVARLERELPPEDGGPLLIYRVGAKDVLVD